MIISADPGSCWLGKKEYAKELIRVAKNSGCDVIKFQLFKGTEYTRGGNIELPHELFIELYSYGQSIGFPVTASVFGEQELRFLTQFDTHHIKFAYSQNKTDVSGLINIGKRVVVSCDDQSRSQIDNRAVKLFCHPMYPVRFKTNFESMFPHDFQGFSDHSKGIEQSLEAANYGCEWIERHIRLNYEDCENVPDGRFALFPKQLETLCKKVKP